MPITSSPIKRLLCMQAGHLLVTTDNIQSMLPVLQLPNACNGLSSTSPCTMKLSQERANPIPRCKYCLSEHHTLSDCSSAPIPPASHPSKQHQIRDRYVQRSVNRSILEAETNAACAHANICISVLVVRSQLQIRQATTGEAASPD